MTRGEKKEDYSGPRPIFYPSLMEVCSAVFVFSCRQTSQQTEGRGKKYNLPGRSNKTNKNVLEQH